MADIALPLIMAGVSAATNLTGNILNYNSVKKTNKQNADLTRETNAQNKAMFDEQMRISQDQYNQSMAWSKYQQQQTWDREDNSLQRGVADAQAAGLSPLAVQGGADAGAVVSQPSMNMPSAPQMEAAQAMPFQWDFNGISDAVRSLQSAIIEDKKMN